MKPKKFPFFIIHIVVIGLILLVAVSPLISVAVAGSIANANGCELHEGFVNPCVVNGVDIGEQLYTLGVLGWLMMVTLPLGCGAALVYTLIVVIVALVRRNRQKRIQSSGSIQAG